ncbi:MAG: G8 domain-containing protein, partial [Deltaproteobacteria bacterium]
MKLSRGCQRVFFVLITASAVLMCLKYQRLIASHTEIPTITNVGSGNWSSPLTWDRARVPRAEDVVLIKPNTAVTYNVWSEVDIKQVIVDGELRFSRFADTNLDTGSLIVNPSGYLEIGTQSFPIPSYTTTQIRLTGNAVKSPGGDPNNMQAMSQGALMVMGEAQMHGSVKS